MRADELQREAAELIQADRHPPAMEKLGDALGIWLTVHEAVVKSAEALELDLDAIRVADGPLRACIDRLPPHFRTAMSLRELEGLSCKKIAEIVGATHVTVRWRLHRGRKLFQEEWERRQRVAEAGGPPGGPDGAGS